MSKAGLSKRQLSIRMGRQPTLIARVERGERTLELREFVTVYSALGLDPAAVSRSWYQMLNQIKSASDLPLGRRSG